MGRGDDKNLLSPSRRRGFASGSGAKPLDKETEGEFSRQISSEEYISKSKNLTSPNYYNPGAAEWSEEARKRLGDQISEAELDYVYRQEHMGAERRKLKILDLGEDSEKPILPEDYNPGAEEWSKEARKRLGDQISEVELDYIYQEEHMGAARRKRAPSFVVVLTEDE